MTPRRDELMAAQYLTAIAGAAALRRCVTEPSVVRDRLGDIRHVVEHLDEFPYDLRIPVFEHPLSEGYALWAERYDGENPALEVDTAEVQPLLAAVPIGTALDAACGTGRHSEFLVPDAVRRVRWRAVPPGLAVGATPGVRADTNIRSRVARAR